MTEFQGISYGVNFPSLLSYYFTLQIVSLKDTSCNVK